MSKIKKQDDEDFTFLDLDEENIPDPKVENVHTKKKKSVSTKPTAPSQKTSVKKPAAENIAKDKSTVAKSSVKKTSKSKKKRKSKVFRICLLSYLGFLAIVAIVVLSVLWNKLAQYQAGIDEGKEAEEYEVSVDRAPQLFFQNYVAGMSLTDWENVWYSKHPDHLDPESDVSALINTEIFSGYTCYKAPNYTKETPVYLIANQQKTLALFTLCGSDLNWEIANIDLQLQGTENGSIEVPESSTVYCNSVALDSDYITATSIGDTDFGYTDSLVNPITYNTYSVEGLLAAPNFTVDIVSGNYSISTDSTGTYYPILASEAAATYRQSADSFVQSLLHYYAYGKSSISENMAAAMSHVASGSEAATIIRQSYDGVHYRSYDGSNYVTSPSDVYVLADNCYCVDVTYEDTNTQEEERETNIYRVYFLDLGNGFKIYNFAYH